MTVVPLTPAEAFVLLDPKRSSAIEAFKIAFLSLIAQGILKITSVDRKGVFRTRRIPVVSVAREPNETVLARPITQLVLRSKPSAFGIELKAVAKTALAEFGQGLFKVKTGHILPALVRRTLLTAEKRRILLVFPNTRYRLSPAGEAEVGNIQTMIDRARTLPALLQSNPTEARAIALAAGSLLLLVPELKAHYGELARLNPVLDAMNGDGGGFDAGSLDTGHMAHQDVAPAIDGNAFGSFDFGSFDFGAFDAGALDMDFSSFDSSFDSSFSDGGGDGGSDGGGGH